VEQTEVAIIGSGFSGICMGIKLKQAGIHDFVILEKDDDLGGTWRDNTYPGCACDIPSYHPAHPVRRRRHRRVVLRRELDGAGQR